MAITGKNIQEAGAFLKEGKLVAIPTETVYGLAANALDEDAVLSIFEAKKRPHFDPLIVHIANMADIKDYIIDFPELALKLAEKFWPGSLTLLLPKSSLIPDLVTAGSKFVGIRIPNHPLTLQLLNSLQFPLAAPSANPFGYISPTNPQHVADQLGDSIEYILDGGECSVGIESTIIGFEDDFPVVMRLGGISIDEIEKVAGPVKLQLNQSSDPIAPGQLKSHYSPKKNFFAGDLEIFLADKSVSNAGVISFTRKYEAENISKNWILSPSGNINEAARNLFRVMREADESGVGTIYAEYVPEEGLGLAINDRIKRASANIE